jgi:hypothetical protein
MGSISRQPEARVGDLRQLVLTVPQAAQILELGVEQIRKAMDRRIIDPTYMQQGNRNIRALDGVDVLCLRLGTWLKGEVWQQLYAHLKHAPENELLTKAIDFSADLTQRGSSKFPLELLHSTATETLAEIASAQDATRLVDEQGMLKDCGVEAHRIAALVAGGMSTDEVLEDYPNLTRDRVEAAVKYAEAKPKQGRPFPSRTVKSVLRNGGGGGLAVAFAAARNDHDGGEG